MSYIRGRDIALSLLLLTGSLAVRSHGPSVRTLLCLARDRVSLNNESQSLEAYGTRETITPPER